MLTVGAIIGGGLRLVRDRPVSVLIWGILYIAAIAIGMVVLFVPFLQVMALGAQTGAPPDPAMMLRLMGQMYLFNFGLLVVLTVLMAAGVRAMLRPDAPGFAYIRLGMDEVRLVGLMLLLLIGSIVVMGVLTILLSIVMAVMVGASGGFASRNAAGGVGAGFFVMMLLVYAVPIFLYVRLSPALTLTMIRRKVVIGEAWRLTRGHFWKMFAGYLVLSLIVGAVYLAIALAVFMPLLGAAMRNAGPAAMAALTQGHVAGFGPILVGGGVVLTVLSGIGIAFWSGGITAATNALLGVQDVDYAATFA